MTCEYGYKKGSNYQDDYVWGTEQETMLFPKLKLIFGDDLVHHLNDRNAKYDFSNSEWNLEMKSRKYKSTSFQDLEISQNKCILRDGKKTGLLMNMIDKVLLIEYLPETFRDFKVVNKARDSIVGAEKNHVYIPTKLFKTIITDHRPNENGCLISMFKK